ncbi:alkaline phosphatase family protein [Piscinibacter terrae]|nr:alkaline phosphatase family protein [Albitalea terrae]
MPARQHGAPLAMDDAFVAWPRDIPMVWDRWARSGGTVRTCAVPFVQPDRLGPALLSHSHVYGPSLARPQVLRSGEALVIDALGIRWSVEAGDHCMRLTGTPQGCVEIAFDTTRHLRLPESAAPSLAGQTHRAIAVRATRIDGEPCLCSLGFQPVLIQGEHAQARCAALQDLAYCAANPARLYVGSRLGRRIDEDGAGEAEALLLDLLDCVHRSFLDDLLWTLESEGGDLVVAYYPLIDLLSHQLLRQVVEPRTASEFALAGSVLRRAATWLGELFVECGARLTPDSRFIAHADHGMMPIVHEVCPNQCLLHNGWLVADATGDIDVTRSLAFYHPAENGWIALHPERMASAGLSPEDLVETLNRSPGAALDGRFELIEGPPHSAGQGWTSTWYLQPPARVRLRASLRYPLMAPARKGGDHTCWSDDPWLKGVLLEPRANSPDWTQPLELTDLAPALLGWLRDMHGSPVHHMPTPPRLAPCT